MAYPFFRTIVDNSKAGQTLTGQLLDEDGVDVGSPISAGVVEFRTGMWLVNWDIPDAHEGGILFLFDGTPYYALPIQPSGGTENLDAKVGSRSSHSAADVWAVGTRTLTSFGTLVADVATAVWAAGTRTLSAFAFSVTVGTNNDKTGYALSVAGVQAIWDALTSALTTVGSIGKLLVDRIDAAISSRMATFTYTAPDNTGIAAIQAKTDNLPADPADASDIAGAFSTVNSTLTTLAGYIDTEVAAIKAKTDTLPDGITKNAALNNFMFLMTDSTGLPLAGLAVTATRSLDGGAFAACANGPTEVANGWYKINLAATDLNADIIALRFTATGARDRNLSIKTEA